MEGGLRRLRPLVLGLALCAGAGCDALSDAVSVDPGRLLSLTAAPSTLPADGRSRALVTARIPQASEVADRTVRFTTTSGTFVGGEAFVEVVADLEGAATVELVAPDEPGNAIVRAEVDSLARSVTVSFTAAPVDHVQVSANPPIAVFLPGLAPVVDVAAQLFRGGLALAREGVLVQFSATDPVGRTIGQFFDVTPTDGTGRAEAKWTPGITDHRGTVTLRARVTDPTTGAVTEGRTNVTLVD